MYNFPLKGKRIYLFAALILLSNVGNSQNIFVAPGGNDSGNGTKKNPFATVEKALEEIAKARNNGQIQSATINLRAGVYPIHHTLKLDGRYSNINIEAYQKEKVICFGGVNIPVNKIESISASDINSRPSKTHFHVYGKKFPVNIYQKGVNKFPTKQCLCTPEGHDSFEVKSCCT